MNMYILFDSSPQNQNLFQPSYHHEGHHLPVFLSIHRHSSISLAIQEVNMLYSIFVDGDPFSAILVAFECICANSQESKGGLPTEVDRVREAHGKTRDRYLVWGEGLEGF